MNKEIQTEYQRMIKIALNDTVKEHFDKFELLFKDVLTKGKVNKRDIRYSPQRPFSCAVNAGLKDEILILAEQFSDDILEISEYEMDNETGEILTNSEVILYPKFNKVISDYDELVKDDYEDPNYDEDDDDDDHNDNYYQVDYNNLSDSTYYDEEDDSEENNALNYYENGDQPDYNDYMDLNTTSSEFEVLKIDNKLGNLSVDDLMPTANDILFDLNPTITGLPQTTNKDVLFTTNQYQSNLFTLYGMLGKSLAKVNASELDKELTKFKNSVSTNHIPEVSDYFVIQSKYEAKVDELNTTSDNIKEQYERNFQEWLQTQIEMLKAQYAQTNPDNTDVEIAQYLAENKPALDALEDALFENKVRAKQALVREFTAMNDNESLSDALRFVMVKELSKDAIKNLMSLYEDDKINQRQLQAEQPTPVAQISMDNLDSEEIDYDDIYNVNNQELTDEINYSEVHEDDHYEGQTQQDLSEIDLSQLSDEELIEYYEREVNGESFDSQAYIYNNDEENTDTFLGHNRDEEYNANSRDYLEDHDSVNDYDINESVYDDEPTDLSDYELQDAELKLAEIYDENEDDSDLNTDYSSETNNFTILDNDNLSDNQNDFVDLGQTRDIPILTAEQLDLENFSDDEQNNDLIDLTMRQDDADLLTGENGLSDSGFTIIEDKDVDLTEVEEKSNKKSKKSRKAKKEVKAKKDKKNKKVKDDKKSDEGKTKPWMIVTGILIALTIGAGGIFGYNMLTNNSPKTEQQSSNSGTSHDEIKKFFEEAEEYIAVDKAIIVPVGNENIEVTITSLNADGSISVEDPNGEPYVVPYVVVKDYVESKKASE